MKKKMKKEINPFKKFPLIKKVGSGLGSLSVDITTPPTPSSIFFEKKLNSWLTVLCSGVIVTIQLNSGVQYLSVSS